MHDALARAPEDNGEPITDWLDLAMEGQSMASVSQRRTRRQATYDPARARAYQAPKKRRWLKRLVLAVALLVILVLVLPTIIACTPLRDAPLRLALRNMHGTVQAGGASLSWFAPLEYTNIEIRNERGEVVLSLAKVASDKSLFGLLSNLNDLGTFRIEQPQANLALRPDGSNLEDLFATRADHPAAFPEPETQPAPASGPHRLPAITAEIIDGTLNVLDASNGQKWLVEKFNLHARMSPESSLPVELTVAAQVPVEGRTAQVAVSSAPAASGGCDHFEAKIDALPLAMFRGLAERITPGVQLSGNLSTNLRLDGVGNTLNPNLSPADRAAAPIQISGNVALENVAATGGPLGSDRLRLARVDLPCKLTVKDRQIDIAQLGINSEIGQLNVTGGFALPAATQPETAADLARLPLAIDGQLDVAKLAAMLPGTLHVRPGTQITSGQVKLALASKPESAGQTWSGQLVASDLAAEYGGRRVTWDQPIQLQLTVHNQASNYTIDALNCTSSFLTFSGQGSLDQFQAEAQCDLDRLMNELAQFIDLGQLKLAGKGDAHLHWSHGASGEFQASSDVRLQGLQIAVPGNPVWQEDAVAASATAAGSIDNLTLAALSGAKLRRLDAAQFNATVDNTAANTHEQIEAKLLPGQNGLSGDNRWPVEIQMQGQLGRWWPRVAGWLGMQDLDLSGAATLAVNSTYSSQGLEIQQAKATVSGLHAWGWNSLFIDEPTVQLEAAGGYDFSRHQLSLARTTLLTSTISLQTEAATVSLGGGGPLVAQGNLSCRADLNRLSRWICDPRVPPKYAFTGLLVGSAAVDRNGSAINGKLGATVEQFAVYVVGAPEAAPRNGLRDAAAGPAPQLVWQENQLTLGASGGFDSAADAMQLTALDIGSQALALHAAGKIDALSSQQNLNLAGKMDYDWNALGPLLRPYLGDRVAFAGRESRNFSVRGALGVKDKKVMLASAAVPSGAASATAGSDPFACLKGLTADVSLGWTQAQLYGMQTGPIDVNAHLENGSVELKPIEAILTGQNSSGQLSIAPLIHLSPGPPEVVLGKGTILSNVQFSEAVSKSWIKFIAPMVSDSARTEGSFSVELDGAHVPLTNPEKADIGGRLVVKNMSVTPGPLFRPFAMIGQQVEALVKGRLPTMGLGSETALLKIDDQKVDFHLVDGRMYHQGLSMQVGQVTIRTRGWVGLDESVNIIAEIPLKEEWTRQRNSPLASLNEPMIRIPIVGNLKDPKFDTRVTAKLLEAIPRATVENGLNNVLDHILPQR
ncbi:MAG TPA: hypothetical protein VFE46_00525 [Pirellulales bacterium]|jgi:hypothetical protein|nr:hypothetical protein [Pirellulales bacterium]